MPLHAEYPTTRARRLLPLAALAMALASPLDAAHAWGDEGHEIIANIAYGRLKPATKKRVDALLAADKDALTGADFASRATWADKWRDSDRDTTKVNYQATRNWHFVDIELDAGSLDAACFNHPALPAGTPASKGPAKTCVVDKVKQFNAELRSPATPAVERTLALKFVLHFVGDLHQPLHASNHHDSGGNGQNVMHGAITNPDNLHSYWDRELVQKLGRDAQAAAQTLNQAISAPQAKLWTAGDAATWAQQANAQAKAVAYDFSGLQMVDDQQGGKAPFLDATYDNRALPVVREQLSKAGVRLAALLNASLK